MMFGEEGRLMLALFLKGYANVIYCWYPSQIKLFDSNQLRGKALWPVVPVISVAVPLGQPL